ncbi:hypothetical protein [Brevundimonas diminuta]|uniref:hypothetical protein n=1 Tax=Brevundimonas diminuta TaxID=293 RepID=UPI003F7F1892
MTLVIVMCSKRKRAETDSALYARDLDADDTHTVASAWGHRLSKAPAQIPTSDLYAGRGFLEARRAAAHLNADLAVVSAGLGLVEATTLAPSYSLTTAPRDADSVLAKTGGSASSWWSALQSASPFSSAAPVRETGLILAGLSAAYLALVADEWSRWPAERLTRLRIFSKERPTGAAEALAPCWMPYDDRLDAAGDDLAGTQGDFAQRALRHFATTIQGSSNAAADSDKVLQALDGFQARRTPVRHRLSDDAVLQLIDAHWATVGGRSGAMLRHLRDTLGFACEQRRFQDLFKRAAANRQLEATS